MLAWWLIVLLSSSAPLVVIGEPLPMSPPQPGFVDRAVHVQRSGEAWWHDATAEGRLVFRRGDGEILSRRQALDAVGADELATRQQVAELIEGGLPFALCLPLMVPALIGVGLGGLAPSVRGDALDDILASVWIGGGLGLLVGGLLAVSLGTGGLLLVQWTRVSDEEASAAVSAYNRRVAAQLGMPVDLRLRGYFGIAPVGAE